MISLYLIESFLFIVLGIILFFFSLWLLDRYFGGTLRHEILVDHNISMAIVISAFTIGISIIIAFAIVGR